MQYPNHCCIKVPAIFQDRDISITLYSPITIFVGANGLGKTQTLKALRDSLRNVFGVTSVRYLSSNRIGTMETFRSKVDPNNYSPNDFNFGGKYYKDHRETNETATGDFFALDEKKDLYIKVAERLSVLFHRHVFLRWEEGSLKAYFEKTDTQKEYSVAVEASGLVNVISILAALYDSAVEFLLIDEPEVSLHPQLQAYILREMQIVSRKYNKTIILSTHSASMIPFDTINSISNLVFFSEGHLPKQVPPDSQGLNSRKLKDFILRISQIYKEGFFAKRVLLVEGTSDNLICRALVTKLNLNIDAAGTQIIPVDGKGQFPAVVKFFDLIGKAVVIMTDLDAFTDDNNVVDLFTCLPLATELANKHGAGSLSEIIRGIRNQINELTSMEKQPTLRNIYELHPYWKCKEAGADINKTLIRSMVGMLFSSSQEEIQKWPDSDKWMQIKTRLKTAFDILESLGCFILRRGSIESYYNFVPNDIYDEKPSKAIEEISGLQGQENVFVEEKYDNIIRALKKVSEAKVIDEGYAVRKELLSELALVMEILPTALDENSIYGAIKQAKGNTVFLFSYKIINEDDKRGVEITLNSTILEVKGFPLRILHGDNVNQLVSQNIVHI